MARVKKRTEEIGAEPAGSIEAIAWWKAKILAAWQRGETPQVPRTMRCILALSAAVSEWTAKRKTKEPEVTYGE